METIRTFIALELDAQIHQQLAQIQDQLKASAADVKWVNPEGIHLTLKFLGYISQPMAEEVEKVIEQLAKAHRCFNLQLGRVGAFPKIEHPRVIWVGISAGQEESEKLAQDLAQRLIKLGFLPEKRPFRPHLTLGRVRSAEHRGRLKELLQKTTVLPQKMPAGKIVLFKSTLTPEGALYQPLHSAKLS